jgi:hypothetical protein
VFSAAEFFASPMSEHAMKSSNMLNIFNLELIESGIAISL